MQDYSCVITNTERLFAAGNNDGLLRDEDNGDPAVPQYASFDELLKSIDGGADRLVRDRYCV